MADNAAAKIAGAAPGVDASVPAMNLDAIAYAQQWCRNWNAHDVEAVLADYHDDVVFTSPIAATILPETAGVVRGKPALRRYWTHALQRFPDLRFAVEDVYRGVDTLVIAYRNQNGHLVNEVLTFDGDIVIAGHGTYRVEG